MKQLPQIRLTAFLPFFQDNLGKPTPEREIIVDFTGARDDGVAMASAGPYVNETICTSIHTDNHASTPPLSFYKPDVFLAPNQQHQTTEDTVNKTSKWNRATM